MKKWMKSIKASTSNIQTAQTLEEAQAISGQVLAVSKSGLFGLAVRAGKGMNNTIWTGLEVSSQGEADDRAVEIRLINSNEDFNGDPVRYSYRDCYIAQGMPSKIASDDDVRTTIMVLQEALDFEETIRPIIQSF